jgi:pSer/pThr/pTyr-binding forkhead associated (FHA) protein
MVYDRDLHTRRHQSPETVHNDMLEDVLSGMNDSHEAKQALYLIVNNQIETLMLAEEQSAIIGRSDSQTGYVPDVNLMQHNARKNGVSREHACIYLRGHSFYLMDLGSNNGTSVCGNALLPHHPQLLHHGDSIRFGLLELHVEIP